MAGVGSILLLSCGLTSASHGAEQEAFVIPFLEGRPTAQGKVAESVWENAAKTPTFTLYKTGESPKRETYAEMFYDTRNLYVRLVCKHPKSEPLRTIVNQESVDAQIFKDDNVEVFLTQGENLPVFHLASSARGIRFDEVDGRAENWNGRWLVATDQNEDHWEATFVIPFDDLSLPDRPSQTPAPGTRWEMNLSRSESRFQEWSQWNFSQSGFAERGRFLPVVFGERPMEGFASIKTTLPSELFVDENPVVFNVTQNLFQPMIVTIKRDRLDLEHAEPIIVYRHRIEEPKAQEFSLTVPVQIPEEGMYRLTAQIASADKGEFLSTFSTVFRALDLKAKSAHLGEQLDKIAKASEGITQKDFKKSANKELEKLRDRFRKISKECEGSLAEGVGQKLTKAIGEEYEAAEKLFRNVQKKLWQEHLLPQDGQALFCIGMRSPFDHVFTEDLFSGTINEPIRLELARNESEATQVVMIPLTDQSLKGVQVEVSKLTHADSDAVIEPTQWRIGKVEYIEAQQQTFDETGKLRRFWPDVCMPPGPFDVEAHTQRPVFLRLTVPSDQSPGLYKGTLDVRVGEEVQTIPMEVEVWNFTLPETPVLRCDTWMRFRSLLAYYQLDEISLDQYEQILKDFEPFRLSIYPFDYIALSHKIKLIREKDGSLGVDFSEFDPYIDLAIRYHANAINLNLGLSGWLTAFAGGWGRPMFTITDRETGVSSPYPAKEDCHWPAEELLASQDFITFWKLLWKHAKEKGWDKVAYVEDVDEPNDNSRKEELIRRHTFFREHCPEIPLLSFGPTPSSFPASVGLIDIWAPVLSGYKSDVDALKKRQEAGDKLWLYTCGASRTNAKGEYTPDTLIDRPLIGNRIPALMAWKFGAEGLFHFTFNSFDNHDDLMNKAKQGQWGVYPILHAPEIKSRFGTSNLTWPGPEKAQLLPSLRLEMIREGREDHAYLSLLKQLTDALETKNIPNTSDLLEESRQMLTVPDRIVTDAYQWTQDPKDLMAWRKNVAQQILKMEKALTQ